MTISRRGTDVSQLGTGAEPDTKPRKAVTKTTTVGIHGCLSDACNKTPLAQNGGTKTNDACAALSFRCGLRRAVAFLVFHFWLCSLDQGRQLLLDRFLHFLPLEHI